MSCRHEPETAILPSCEMATPRKPWNDLQVCTKVASFEVSHTPVRDSARNAETTNVRHHLRCGNPPTSSHQRLQRCDAFGRFEAPNLQCAVPSVGSSRRSSCRLALQPRPEYRCECDLVSVARHSPVSRSQTFSVCHRGTGNNVLPSDVTAPPQTRPSWPSRTIRA